MMNALATLYGIGIVCGVIVFLDWLGRRQHRRKREARAHAKG
jgi:hypothetical protein